MISYNNIGYLFININQFKELTSIENEFFLILSSIYNYISNKHDKIHIVFCYEYN